MFPRPEPVIIHRDPSPAARRDRQKSPLSSRKLEDDSDRETKTEARSFNKLIKKINVKSIMRQLPDHAIMRLVDVSILEMVTMDVGFLSKAIFLGVSAKNPPKDLQNYSDHLQKFLMT